MSCFEGGPVPIQSAGDFLDQALDTARGGPDGLAIIEHQGKDRREKLALSDTSGTQEILIEEAQIGHESDGHESIARGLELEEQVHVELARSPPDAPDEIVLPVAQVFGDEAAGSALEGGEVELVNPVLLHEGEEEVTHHLRGRRGACMGDRDRP